MKQQINRTLLFGYNFSMDKQQIDRKPHTFIGLLIQFEWANMCKAFESQKVSQTDMRIEQIVCKTMNNNPKKREQTNKRDR